MTLIDFHASEIQFVHHMAPIWHALPLENRGDFITMGSLRWATQSLGITSLNRIEDPNRPVVVASYGDHKRVRRMGRKNIARLEHGAGQSYFGDMRFGGNSSYAGGKDCHDASLFLCPNDYSADRWQAAYPGARVEVVGCPKLDDLPAKGDGPLTVAISFHFNIPNIIPETLWTWPYYRSVLPALAERFTVIGHCHPKASGYPGINQHYRRANIEVVPDFADVCRRADVYIADNTSTLFEFASTGRPVVVLNSPDFRRDVSHGGRYWDWSTVGIQVDKPADLIPAVELALTDPPEVRAERERVLGLVYPIRTGAAQRAADALLSWAGVRQEVAA